MWFKQSQINCKWKSTFSVTIISKRDLEDEITYAEINIYFAMLMKGICHKFGELCIMLPMRNSSLFSLFHLILRFSLCHLMQQNSFKNVLSRCICFFFFSKSNSWLSFVFGICYSQDSSRAFCSYCCNCFQKLRTSLEKHINLSNMHQRESLFIDC